MQEEVNQKVISLSIQGVKITASVLKAALRKFLEMDNRRKQKATQVKMAEKTGRAQEKGREKARTSDYPYIWCKSGTGIYNSQGYYPPDSVSAETD